VPVPGVLPVRFSGNEEINESQGIPRYQLRIKKSLDEVFKCPNPAWLVLLLRLPASLGFANTQLSPKHQEFFFVLVKSLV